jgi:hypothetical protein
MRETLKLFKHLNKIAAFSLIIPSIVVQVYQ